MRNARNRILRFTPIRLSSSRSFYNRASAYDRSISSGKITVQEADVSTCVTPASVAACTTLLQRRAEQATANCSIRGAPWEPVSLVGAIINLILHIRRYAALINNAAHCSIVSSVADKVKLCLRDSVRFERSYLFISIKMTVAMLTLRYSFDEKTGVFLSKLMVIYFVVR